MKNGHLLASLFTPLFLAGCASSRIPQSDPVRQTTPFSNLISIVPFTLFNGFILFEGQLDTVKGPLVLDTGSPVIALNPFYQTKFVPPGSAQGTLPYIKSVRLGNLTVSPTQAGPLDPPVASNAGFIPDNRLNSFFEKPALASYGLTGLEPFETIIDYPNRRLIFIRLDSTGHRMTKNSDYTIVDRIPLVPCNGPTGTRLWWGVLATISGGSGAADTVRFFIDTGAPPNMLGPSWGRKTLTPHVVELSDTAVHPGRWPRWIKQITVGDQKIDSLAFNLNTPNAQDVLGYEWLKQYDVIGFNFRTRQLLLYKSSRQHRA